MLCTRAVLVLEGTAELGELQLALGPVHRAANPDAAAHVVATLRPEVIAFNPDMAWQRAFIATLAADSRPAVIAVGGSRGLEAALIDEWLPLGREPDEVVMRISLARQRGRARRREMRRAFVDSLTGLANRRASVRGLLRESERARRNGTPLSLVLIDLDDFKAVNEEGGHPAGDRLLRKVGAALRKVTRGIELCGRIGGDEFALVVPAKADVALRAARRAKDALMAIGVSASVAACEADGNERLKDLYRRCDRALNAVKEQRRHGALPALEEDRPNAYAV